MYEDYYNHYVLIREDGAIIDGWSDGVKPECEVDNAICINSKGKYQFEIIPGGENLPLCNLNGIPLYKWDGQKVIRRATEEIQKDLDKLPPPLPDPQEQLRADVDFLLCIGGFNE